MSEYSQIAYLYHLPLEGALDLGEFVLWPYHKCRDAYVSDVSVKRFLNKFFLKMRDYRNRPLKNIAVLSKKRQVFEPVSTETHRKMNDVVNALLISSVCENNSIGAVSSNNFHLIVQNFKVGDEGWAIEDGSYVKVLIGGLRLSDAGVRLSPVSTYLREYKCDMQLLNALLKCLEDGGASQKRIFSSLQWMAYSYDNSPRFPYFNRILLLMIAFEILGDCPGAFDRRKFADWLEELWGVPKERKVFLSSEKKLGPYGPLGWWGIEFYCLRNDVIHNKKNLDELSVFDRHGREYFKTGVFVFAECLKELLSKDNYFEKPVYTDMIRYWRLSKKDKADEDGLE